MRLWVEATGRLLWNKAVRDGRGMADGGGEAVGQA